MSHSTLSNAPVPYNFVGMKNPAEEFKKPDPPTKAAPIDPQK